MKSTFSDSQIATILKQVAEGTPVKKVCCEHNVSHVTVYRWRRKFGKPNSESPASSEKGGAETSRPQNPANS